MLLYLSQEVGFADVEAVAAYHGADVLAGAAAADVAEFVVLRGVGGGGGDEGLRFAFAEPALRGCGGHGLREGDFFGKFGENLIVWGNLGFFCLTRWGWWGRIRIRSCNRQQLISLGMELARRLEAWRPRIADRRPPALRGVFLCLKCPRIYTDDHRGRVMRRRW